MKTLQNPSPPSSVDFAKVFGTLAYQRRATPHFLSDPVPDEVIETALTLAGQAPSGYNLQPWRFVVVRNSEQRARLRKAAMDQEKITEAPLVVVAFAEHEGWKQHMDEIIATRAELTGRKPGDVEKLKAGATDFITNLGPTVWLNRHVMIAFTYLMLAFESLGWDTGPMEGFEADKVKQVLGLPPKSEVVAILAVGRAADPDTPFPGRLNATTLAFQETYGESFSPRDTTE
jgi:nitroreductase